MQYSIRSTLPRQKLIDTASHLVFRQGWSATGINQILEDADVPKGSFYYYFQSKDDLGVAIVQNEGERLRCLFAETLENPKLTGREAIEAYGHFVCERQRSEGWRWGSPIGTLASEVVSNSEKIAAACRDVFEYKHKTFSKTVARGQCDDSIVNKESAELLALRVILIWQGAELVAKVRRSDDSLREAIAAIRVMFAAAS